MFSLDKILNYLFVKFGKTKMILGYINNQKILSKVPKIARERIFRRIYISRKHELIFF